MGQRFILTESDRSDIRKLYGLLNEETTTPCTLFNEKSKNLVYDYDQIITSYSASTKLNDLNLIFNKINEDINANSTKYKSQGIPDRTSCEIAFVKLRPQFQGKKIIVVDSLNQLIYLFDENSNFVAKDPIITGKSDQVSSEKQLADMTYDEKKEYLKNILKREPTSNEIYNLASFLNPGAYKTGIAVTEPSYAGSGKNISYLRKVEDDKLVGPAIHGVKPTKERLKALKNAVSKIGTSSENPNVSKEYSTNYNKSQLELSSGCLNITKEFVDKYALTISNSFLFNISEDQENYYVMDWSPVIDATKCFSIEGIGGKSVDNLT